MGWWYAFAIVLHDSVAFDSGVIKAGGMPAVNDISDLMRSAASLGTLQ